MLMHNVAPLVLIDQAVRVCMEPMLVLTCSTEFGLWLSLVKLFAIDVLFFGVSREAGVPSQWTVRVGDVVRRLGEWLLLRCIWFPLNSFLAMLLLSYFGETPCLRCRFRPELVVPLPVFFQIIAGFYAQLFGRRQEEAGDGDNMRVTAMSTCGKKSRFRNLRFIDEPEEETNRKKLHARNHWMTRPPIY